MIKGQSMYKCVCENIYNILQQLTYNSLLTTDYLQQLTYNISQSHNPMPSSSDGFEPVWVLALHTLLMGSPPPNTNDEDVLIE